MKTNINQQSERQILLSLADKDYSGDTADYTPVSIKIGSLESIVKKHNYSPISWYTNHRLSTNFKSVTGFCVDSDRGMTVQQALDKLQQLGWNYFLITTRNHQIGNNGDRFRIFIPFNKTVYSYSIYRQIIDKICEDFPQSDPQTFDGARQLYGSPDTATYSSRWDGIDFDVDPFLKEGEWDSSIRLFDTHKNQIKFKLLKSKTPIYCPFHNDSNASAFIEYSDTSKNHFIHCSSCNKSFWKIIEPLSMEERCKEFYSIGTGIFQVSITAGEFSMSEIGEKKFHALIGAVESEERNAAYAWLMQNHHFKDMKRVEHIGDMEATSTYFEVWPDDALIRVHYAPLKEEIKDNDFIEQYLDINFGGYKKTIKEYMAVYCYTNYRKLPFLILTGKRGAGKNSFAELLGEIFHPLSIAWGAKAGQFTPEYEKKLLIADETVTEDHKQYLDLKRQSGSKYLPVNKKFQHPYQVKNNVNIIILSNARYPIQVERNEVPADDKDNQFFVYKMERKYAQVDATYAEKLRQHLGHYIRTELKTVFDGLDINSYRYSIPVPITDYEKELFGSSVTAEEQYVDNILLKFKDAYNGSIPSYEPFFKKGLVPSDFIDDTIQKVDKHKVVKQLRSEGYLTVDKTTRDAINKERKYCYTATPLLMAYLQS
jgi:hypothetical protein